MPDLNAIVGVLFTLFIVFLLGYVFITVFSALSPTLAFLFGIVLVVVVIGMLSQILRR